MAVRLLDSKIQINSLAPVVIGMAAREVLRSTVRSIANSCVETNITPDKALFKQMIVTPASTLTRAVAKFMENPGLTGQLAEIHGDSVTLRPDAEYVDVDTEKNLRMFWELGHA
jgi:hypothetical protein